jgi:class 3 adenylate cyclase
VNGGQTLLAALVQAHVPLAHACGGKARCSTCRVRVVEGSDALEPRTEAECAMAATLRFDDQTRLACQTRIRGDVTVRRLVIDDTDLSIVAQGREMTEEERADSVGHRALSGVAGRELEIAVMFADVANFTPLSETLPPYDVMHLLNRYFHDIGPLITANGGYIDNYMGDGFMALFGVDGRPDATGSAVRAGLDILTAVQQLDAYVQELYGKSFGVRVGIHFGPAVVGLLGSCHKRRETAIGDAVNVAARIEAANKPAGTKLLISDAALAQLGDRATIGKIVDVALKGKSGTHTLHEVTALA